MVLDYSKDLTPLVGEDGFDDPAAEPPPSYALPEQPAKGTDPTPAPAKQTDDTWDVQMRIYQGLRDEVPAVPTSSSFFGRFGDIATNIVGKPLDMAMTALEWPADTLERAVGMGYWALAYPNDLDLAQRWKLGGITWEAMTGRDTSEIAAKIEAGEDLTKLTEEYEGGWGDTIMKIVSDPLNIFGFTGLGMAAKVLPKGSLAAKGLMALNKGVTADMLDAATGLTDLRKMKQRAFVLTSAGESLTAEGRLELDVLQGTIAASNGARGASDLAISFMRKIGLNESELSRIQRNITNGIDRSRAANYDIDSVRAAGKEWFARPTNWLRQLTSQTPESKRNEMGHTFWVNLRQNAETTPDWSRLRQYTSDILDGNPAGMLVGDHPEWALPLGGTKFDQPIGLMAIQAMGDHAKAMGVTVDDLPSMRKGWFQGTDVEWKALPPEAKKTMYMNQQTWVAQWEQDMYMLAGDGKKAGAFDHYAGMAVEYVEDADGKITMVPRERTGTEVVFEEVDKLYGHAKNAMSIFWLNTPRYAMANAVSNVMRALTSVGSGAWRWDESLATKFGGKELIELAAADPARLRDMSLTLGKGGKQPTFWNKWGKFFVYQGSQNAFFGDNAMRRKIALTHADRTIKANWEKIHGVLDKGDLSDESWEIVQSGLRERAWHDPRGFMEDLSNGTVGVQPAAFIFGKALDGMDIKGDARWLYRDVLSEDVARQINEAHATANTPDEFARAFDRIAGSEVRRQYEFQPIEGSIVKGVRPPQLFDRRVINEQVIIRAEQERTAAFKRIVEMKGGDPTKVDEILQPFVREQQARQRALYEKIDFELPDGVAGAGEAREKLLRAYEAWEDKSWTAMRNQFQKTYKRIPGLGDYFKGANADRLETAKNLRSIRNDELAAQVAKYGNRQATETGDVFNMLDAIRHNEWNSHLDRLMEPMGLHRIEYTRETPGDGAFSMAQGFVALRESTSELLGKMKEHAPDLFVDMGNGTWAKKAAALTPEQSQRILAQLPTLEEDASLMRAIALRSGEMMANHALLNYDRKFGIDGILKFALPYHFWPSRMAHRFVRASMARPGAAGAFAVLVDGMNEITEGMPARFKGKVGIPLPFLPDWMGDELYFDPIKMLFPFSTGLNQGDIEGETMLGTIDNWMASIGAGAAPWVTMPMQMTGAFGEREKWIRYQMQGMPFGLPGTPAQQGIWSLLSGDPPDDWQDDVTAEDVRNLTLGEAFPEPRLREILGIPAGDQWDFYRALRMLANMTGDGTITAEEAMKAAKFKMGPTWDKAMARAGDESGIRNLSSWALGMPGSIYPKGEEIQDGLKMIFDAAREADRKGATDGNTTAFFSSFPEYQVRQVQKTFYRGIEELDSELDTDLYFIDLAKVGDLYDPQIAEAESLKARLPKGMRKDASDRLEYLYEAKGVELDRLKRVYSKRKLTPSVYAAPHDRALAMMREQYYQVDGQTVGALMGGRDAFLDRFTGKGMSGSYYALANEADKIIAEYDQRLAEASNQERDDIYRSRQLKIEELTSRASQDLSAQDFMAYLESKKREPGDEEAKRQKNADSLRMLFNADEDSRKAILAANPLLAEVYGTHPDPVLAGTVNSWYAGYSALRPNSMARDDYVQSQSPQLNLVRELLGLPPLTPRERPKAGPLVQYEDPYFAALDGKTYTAPTPAAAAAPAPLGQEIFRDQNGLITETVNRTETRKKVVRDASGLITEIVEQTAQ